MESKEAARILFNDGSTQKDIASMLNISEKTISDWAKKGNWDKKRSESNLKKQTSEEGVWELINYQLKVLKLIKEKHEVELENCTDLKEIKAKLIDRGDIDALQKLFTTIKGKEMEWSQRVKVIREFTEYLEGEDTKLAQSVVPLANQYLNEKRND